MSLQRALQTGLTRASFVAILNHKRPTTEQEDLWANLTASTLRMLALGPK